MVSVGIKTQNWKKVEKVNERGEKPFFVTSEGGGEEMKDKKWKKQ